jgi:hypothetical protein
MNEPTPKPQQVRDAELNTGVMRGIEQLDSLNAGLESHALDPVETVPPQKYKKERLFSRKVLFGWAAATLVLWFSIRVIAPIVVESVESAIVSSIEADDARSGAAAVPAPPVPPVPAVAPVPPPDPANAPDAALAPEATDPERQVIRHREIVSVRGPFIITISDGKIKKIMTKQ